MNYQEINMGKCLYIIDSSNWRVKFQAALSSYSVERNGVTVSTSSIAGFAKSLSRLPFDDILICLDGVPQNSLNVLPTYKGTRNGENDGGMSVSRAEEVKFLTKLGERVGKNITVVCSPLQETDQIISSITHYITGNLPARWEMINMLNTKDIADDGRLAKYTPVELTPISRDYLRQFESVVIASTDADFCQLLRFGNVYIDTSVSGSAISNERLTASTSQLAPIQTILYKCLIGDGGDNVPSLPFKNVKQVQGIIETVDTMFKVDEFFKVVDSNCAYTPTMLTPLASKLAEFVARYHKRQFEINREVTYLQFFSLPQVLSYPDYDIEKTISAYRLKV